MKRTPRILIAILACAMVSQTALAEEGVDRRGWYFGINGIAANYFSADNVEEIAPGGDAKASGGLNVRAGYRVTPWFTAEFLYEWVNAMGPLDSTDDRYFEQQTHSLFGNARFLLPGWVIEPYLGAGVGTQHSAIENSVGLDDEKSWSFVGRPAIGADWIVNDYVTVNLEFAGLLSTYDPDVFGLSTTDLWYYTVGGGVMWRF